MAGWRLPEAAAGRAGPGLVVAPGLQWCRLGCAAVERFGAWSSCSLASDQGVWAARYGAPSIRAAIAWLTMACHVTKWPKHSILESGEYVQGQAVVPASEAQIIYSLTPIPAAVFAALLSGSAETMGLLGYLVGFVTHAWPCNKCGTFSRQKPGLF